MNNILKITDLTKSYNNFTLDALNLLVPYGTIMGLIGENGAGKTTTINLILNSVEKDYGNISVFGKDHIKHEKEIKQNIGVVFDECNLPGTFDITDIERFLSKMYTSWSHQKYLGYIERFELPDKQIIKNFSKEMRVKLNFAVALSHDPQLLILDEATSGLDPVMRDDMLDVLLDFVQDEKKSVLFSSHITTDLEKIADYVSFLHKGKLLFCAKKDDLIYNYGLIHSKTVDFEKIDKSDILAYRKLDCEWRVLVNNREAAAKKYKNYIVDPTTIEDIMFMFIRGEQK